MLSVLGPMILTNLLLLATLAGSPDVEGLRRELDGVAARIEQLKARAQAGESVEGELEPLLVRSQELAEQLERALPEPPAPSPASADAVRERADELRSDAAALRGEAQRLGSALAAIEVRIAVALRAAASSRPAAPAVGFAHARLASTATPADERPATPGGAVALRELVEQRARLAAQIDALQVEAARLDAEANALDRE